MEEKSWTRLYRGHLKRETETLIIAALNTLTNYIKTDKQSLRNKGNVNFAEKM